jgi:hypothetical protein
MRTVFRLVNVKGKDNLEDLCVVGKLTLEWILGKWGGGEKRGLDSSGSG